MRLSRFRLVLSLVLLGCGVGVAGAQQPLLSVDRSQGVTRVWASSPLGGDYNLESSTNNMGSWDFLLRLNLTNSPRSWLDASSTLAPMRFYRAVTNPNPPELARDFRLIDHLGRSRSLWYYLNASTIQTNIRAITLIFTGNGCSKIRDMVPTITNLNQRFGTNVLFWLIDSNQQDTRSNIFVEATSLWNSNGPPILHDAAQLVARAYNATATPEAIAVDTASFRIFYRGSIDDRLGSSAVGATQNYLSNALVNFLAGQPVIPSRSVPPGCEITLKPRYTNISYSAEIAPLLQAKCVRCHSPGNIGSWAMTNYSIVSAYSNIISDRVRSGKMPPWHADPNYGVFTNDFSLKPDEAAKLVQWADDGALRGTGPDPLATDVPAATNYPYIWPVALGQPTNIVTIPTQTISGVGDENYHYVSVATTFTNDVWLSAAVIRPDNISIVHHCLIYTSTTSQLGGMDGFFAGYVPGLETTTFPPGTGKFLPKGTTLTFQIHYIRNGHSNTDRTQLGLYTMSGPPAFSLQTKSAYNYSFTIPANKNDYQTTSQFGPFPKAVYLYEMSPHMHLRGSRFKYEAVYPDNSRELLLSVPWYEFNWQALYRLAQPKLLPAGTVIFCTGAWDNSTQNRQNPNANTSVTFGEQTENEMFIGYFNYAELP